MGFFGFRKKMIQYVQEHGGMYELYKLFVDILLEDGFQLREVTNDSLYVHYGTDKGKIGIQIIQGSIEKIQIIVAEELPFNRRNSFKIDTITDFPISQVHDKILANLKLVVYPQIR